MPIIQFRVSDEELNQIKDAARETTVSDYVRSSALSRVKEANLAEVLSRIDMFHKAFNDFAEKNLREAPPNEAQLKPTGLRPGSLAAIKQRTQELEDRGEVFNPYEGWWVTPAPDGSVEGYYSDHHQATIKVITNGKRSETLLKGNSLYDLF